MKKISKIFNYLRNIVRIKYFHVNLGHRVSINGKVFFSGKNISIGNNVTLNSGFKYNPIGGQERLLIVTSGRGKITIGNNVGISNSSIVSHESIVIEDNVFIGGSCKIYDTDFHSLELEQRLEHPDSNIKTRPVVIKSGAFIGAHSIILKGVIVGNRSIIGAGSVVTKNIPDGEIWGGNPAKFIKKID